MDFYLMSVGAGFVLRRMKDAKQVRIGVGASGSVRKKGLQVVLLLSLLHCASSGVAFAMQESASEKLAVLTLPEGVTVLAASRYAGDVWSAVSDIKNGRVLKLTPGRYKFRLNSSELVSPVGVDLVLRSEMPSYIHYDVNNTSKSVFFWGSNAEPGSELAALERLEQNCIHPIAERVLENRANDTTEAFEFCMEAKRLSSQRVDTWISMAYKNGAGVAPNEEKALAHINEAIVFGDGMAAYYKASWISQRTGGFYSKEYRETVQKAVDFGFEPAVPALLGALIDAARSKSDWENVKKVSMRALELKSAFGLYGLAMASLKANPIKPDYQRSYKLLRLAVRNLPPKFEDMVVRDMNLVKNSVGRKNVELYNVNLSTPETAGLAFGGVCVDAHTTTEESLTYPLMLFVNEDAIEIPRNSGSIEVPNIFLAPQKIELKIQDYEGKVIRASYFPDSLGSKMAKFTFDKAAGGGAVVAMPNVSVGQCLSDIPNGTLETDKSG